MVAKTQRKSVKCNECGADIIRSAPIGVSRNFFCNKTCKGLHQKRAKLLTKDELHELYIVQEKTAVDIGLMVGRDPKSVWNWLVDYGIPTRPRGSDERQHFTKGHKICIGRSMSDATKEKIRQARIADGSRCLFLPNGDHVLKGKRGASHPSWQGGVTTPVRQSFYASDAWKSACVTVWRRDNAICQRCILDHRSIDRQVMKFHIHHIYGFTRFPSLRADPNNLVLLCETCHRWVHSKSNINKDWIKK